MSTPLNNTNISELLKISEGGPQNIEMLKALTQKFQKRLEGLRVQIKPSGSKETAALVIKSFNA